MISNYCIYLTTLSKEEAIKQIFIILTIFFIILAICVLIKYLEYKFNNKKSFIKNFLKKP